MWTYISADELAHHGVKGQKWGIRRFQRKDGSLTPAGRKRYADDGPDSKPEIKETFKSPGKDKGLSQMSDKELQATIKRYELERQYVDQLLKREEQTKKWNEYHPKKASLGEQVLNDVIMPGLKSAGKDVVSNLLKEIPKKLGLEEEKTQDAYTLLKKKVDMLDMQKRYKELTSPDTSTKERDKLKLEFETESYRSKIKKLKGEDSSSSSSDKGDSSSSDKNSDSTSNPSQSNSNDNWGKGKPKFRANVNANRRDIDQRSTKGVGRLGDFENETGGYNSKWDKETDPKDDKKKKK